MCMDHQEGSKKILGIWINLNLNWECQEQTLIKKANYMAFELYSNCFTTKQKVTIFKRLLQTSVSYAQSICLLSKDFNQKINDAATRVIKAHLRIPKNTRNERL